VGLRGHEPQNHVLPGVLLDSVADGLYDVIFSRWPPEETLISFSLCNSFMVDSMIFSDDLFGSK